MLALGARPAAAGSAQGGRRCCGEQIREYFAPLAAPVFKGFDDWYGADVVVATGWQTVYPALLLAGCRARAYLVNDHEPEFFADLGRVAAGPSAPTRSACTRIAAQPVAARPRTRALRRHGDALPASASTTTSTARARSRAAATPSSSTRATSTPRRAVPLGLLALAELHAPPARRAHRPVRRPRARRGAVPATSTLGVAAPSSSRALYSEATVGLCLSLTNYSLIPQEMLACGLPVRRPRRPSARVGVRRGRAGRARRRSTRRARRRASSGCSTTRPSGSAARSRAASSSPAHTWDARRRSRSSESCATHCARASRRPRDAACGALLRRWERCLAVSPLLAFIVGLRRARVPGARRAVALRLRPVAGRAPRAARETERPRSRRR